MKRIIFTAVVIACMSPACLFARLTDEEINTIHKLGISGVFTYPRTVEEWEAPIRTKDCASAMIKSLSRTERSIDNVWRRCDFIETQTDTNLDLVSQQTDKNREDIDGQLFWNVFLGCLAVAGLLLP
jgi:hypothetical protein